ncbi:XdhC family protein [Oceanicoccus sp. KOV_DT_Chl]|uniref:XdhC family protein n=1 Tax=Oceanicoccus sp. KOV_DT_Chl TaxID=1904639 RepID=UPI000C7E435D|nr:XdhC family protein [Oceanicoccus sp. KOV_DT_Chl]
MSNHDFLDLAVISQLNRWLHEGTSCWLCTVVETWGSSPRRTGSLLACNSEGIIVGSLSGGCVEDDLIAQLQTGTIAADRACYKIYGQTQTDIERFKLPCGGTLGILIEPFVELISDTIKQQFIQIEQSLLQRKAIQRTVNYTDGTQSVDVTHQRPDLHLDKNEHHQPRQLQHTYGPEVHLMIIGICEVSRYLAQFALATGYRVSVCDPRPELKSQWQIDNTSIHTGMPDDVVRDYANDPNCAIVTVSHDPRLDDMGLMDAFSTPAFYLGAMGSQASSNKRRQRLLQLGISEQQLHRLHAPIGIDIHSKTPAEIAIAIIADIIARYNEPR